MPKTIAQAVVFKNTTPAQLYKLYMDAKLTGGAAKISNRVGATFSAYGGYCFGKNLHLQQNRLIVQTWRSTDFKKTDADSIFSILLEQGGKDTVLYMTHANLPDKEAAGVKKGWNDFYWKPWKGYLKTTAKK
jgi:activator of HSP90 ATPase